MFFITLRIVDDFDRVIILFRRIVLSRTLVRKQIVITDRARRGLCQFSFKIAAAFDINPDLAGMNYGGTTIYHIDDFAKVKKDSVKIGVLTVPVESSQEVANLMIENGIKAIWNFTPVRIKTPPDIVVQNTSIYAHLAVIFNRLHSK